MSIAIKILLSAIMVFASSDPSTDLISKLEKTPKGQKRHELIKNKIKELQRAPLTPENLELETVLSLFPESYDRKKCHILRHQVEFIHQPASNIPAGSGMSKALKIVDLYCQ